MTHDEFNTFKTAYFAAFPSTWEWLVKVRDSKPPSHDEVRPVLASWYRTLQRTELADALTVLAKLENGTLEPIQAYDRDKTALHVRAYAGRIADARRKHSENQRLIDQGTRRESSRVSFTSCGGLYRTILELSDHALEMFPEERELPPASRHRVHEWVTTNMNWDGLKR